MSAPERRPPLSPKISLSEATGLLCQLGINAETAQLRRLAKRNLLAGVNVLTTPTGRLYFERAEISALGQVFLIYHPGAEAA